MSPLLSFFLNRPLYSPFTFLSYSAGNVLTSSDNNSSSSRVARIYFLFLLDPHAILFYITLPLTLNCHKHRNVPYVHRAVSCWAECLSCLTNFNWKVLALSQIISNFYDIQRTLKREKSCVLKGFQCFSKFWTDIHIERFRVLELWDTGTLWVCTMWTTLY